MYYDNPQYTSEVTVRSECAHAHNQIGQIAQLG